jgi:hypothetical protein
MLIKLTYNLLLKNLDITYKNKNQILSKLENILVVAIINYTKAIFLYKNNYPNNLNLNIPLDLPNPFYQNQEFKTCYCDHINKKTNSILLLFSNYKLEYNFYSSPELNTFCKNNCLNSNAISRYNIKNKTSDKKFTFNNPNRNYSTIGFLNSKNKEKNKSNFLENTNKARISYFNSNQSPKFKEINFLEKKTIKYNKNIFSILNKIKELTSDKIYDPVKVQFSIENF